ncbi:F-box protein At1g11270-like [Brassica napus]|uniref:(rape) hypothetical protein n=1 Tax=Brassica napus TaxID=3708 RepID=A0A816UXR3_BRANA|nr:F-box protein At1g11270-like [Brassica napus]CAF2115929.1 unnamed protein product [Brassica napus]
MLRRHNASVELLPHDVVELILERLPVDSLLRFKSVSKKWKSTTDSGRFQQGQFLRRRQSRGPDVLCLPLSDDEDTDATRFAFGSSKASTVWFPVSRKLFCYGSCDGLLCLCSLYEQSASVVVNPATRWHRSFPLSNVQHLIIEKNNKSEVAYPLPRLGFGKDKVTGTYKPVYLYNSFEFKLDNVTTCEVFDFRTNAWRYVVPSSPYRILGHYEPVYLDGSLYYLTKEETEVLPFSFPAETSFEVKLLSLDLHTETFQVICKAPFVQPHSSDLYSITMCILDDRLCVSEKNWPNQEIWSFDGANKTWTVMCSIDLTESVSLFEERSFARSSIAQPSIALVDKNKLLLRGNDYFHTLFIYDLHTKSFDLLFKPPKPVGPVYYFESLFHV